MKNLLVGMILASLIFFSGCINLTFEGKQDFREDGTSKLRIDQTSQLKLSSLGSLYNTSLYGNVESPSNLYLKLYDEYSSSSAYGKFFCNRIKSDDVKKCTPNDDGSSSLEASLSPGDFYQFQKTFDLINLREVYTYTIEKVPTLNYYSIGNSYSDFNTASTEDFKKYARENAGKYLTKDFYCDGAYYFNCTYSKSSGELSLKTLYSYDQYDVLWAACSDRTATGQYYYSETEAKDAVASVTPVNRTITYSQPTSLWLNCPLSTKSIIMAYTSKSSSYYGYGSNYSYNRVVVIGVKTKADVIEEVANYPSTYSSTYGTSSLTQYQSLKASDYVIDFEKGKFFGSKIDDLTRVESLYRIYGAKIDVSYSATFPGKILSATSGSRNLKTKGNSVSIDFSDLEDISDPIEVTSVKEFSPLGVFTWAILGAVILGGIAFVFLMMKPKSS